MEAAAIRKRIRLVFELKGQVEQAMAHRLDIPMETILQKGTLFLKNWLAMHEKSLYQSAARETAHVLQGMGPLEFYFGHIDDPG